MAKISAKEKDLGRINLAQRRLCLNVILRLRRRISPSQLAENARCFATLSMTFSGLHALRDSLNAQRRRVKQNYKFEARKMPRGPKQIRMIKTKDSMFRVGPFRISRFGFWILVRGLLGVLARVTPNGGGASVGVNAITNTSDEHDLTGSLSAARRFS
jgi:hypothetical protein